MNRHSIFITEHKDTEVSPESSEFIHTRHILDHMRLPKKKNIPPTFRHTYTQHDRMPLTYRETHTETHLPHIIPIISTCYIDRHHFHPPHIYQPQTYPEQRTAKRMHTGYRHIGRVGKFQARHIRAMLVIYIYMKNRHILHAIYTWHVVASNNSGSSEWECRKHFFSSLLSCFAIWAC